MKTSKTKRNSILLVITALIWGVAFVAQSEGGDAVGPYTFNGIRSLIGGAVLLPVIVLLDRLGFTSRRPQTKEEKKTLWTGGICCGAILFIASSLQQLGMYLGTPVGKAGFLTSWYIILVPILGIFLKKKVGIRIWISVLIAVAGLYLLCMTEGFRLEMGDALVLICALCFSIHILVIDHFSPLVDGVRLSCVQFVVAGTLGCLCMFLFENPDITLILQAWKPILYAGAMSSGVAYTLQIVGQKGMNPTVASLIMSLESVISAIAGFILLKQSMSLREVMGCVIMFVAIILAQLPEKSKN